MTTRIQNLQDLQRTTEVGATTTVNSSFTDGVTGQKNSGSAAAIIANQLAATGPVFSVRTQSNEFLSASVQNVGVIFAGLIGSLPVGVTWTGFLRSSFTSGFTLDASDFFTFYGLGGLNFRGGTVSQGFNLVTSAQGGGIISAQLKTLFTNNAGIIQIPDPGATTKTLAIVSTKRDSWVYGPWNTRNILTTLTDQAMTLGALTPGQFIFEISGSISGWSVELDQVVTAGTLTVTLWKNGATTGNTITFVSTDPVRKSATLGTAVTFAAGDRAEIRWTTTLAFLPTGVIDINASIRGAYDE